MRFRYEGRNEQEDDPAAQGLCFFFRQDGFAVDTPCASDPTLHISWRAYGHDRAVCCLTGSDNLIRATTARLRIKLKRLWRHVLARECALPLLVAWPCHSARRLA